MKENPIALRSKAMITEALIALMQEKPFTSISILDISKKADLVRQTFYLNFKSKEDVLKRYLDGLFDAFTAHIKTKNITSIKELSYCYFYFWNEHTDFIKLLIKNDLSYILIEQFSKYLQSLSRTLCASKSETFDIKAEYAYIFLASALANILVQWITDGQTITVDEMTLIVCDILHGEYFYLDID